MSAAVEKGDGQTALSRASSIPDFQDSYLLFLKARAHLLTGDYSSAETELRAVLRTERNLENAQVMAERFPALGILSHYYLGQLYERTDKRDQAINEYQEFLSHFERSHTRLPQLGEARTALKRLMMQLTGDTPNARSAYQDFFALWKDADPDIPILKQAKAEYAKLQ
jgi:tetratricopeptide (TPR) repeat protein